MSNHPVEGDFKSKDTVAYVFHQGKWVPCDLRTPYERGRADMLEQVLEWIEECPNYDLDFHSDHRRMIADLKEAMRPQEDNS